MSITGTLNLQGQKEVQRLLKGLPPKIQKKILRRALRAGAKPIRDEARSRAPVDTGQGRKGIVVRSAGKLVKRGMVGVVVKTTEGDFKGEEFYMSFHEYGYLKHPVFRTADGKFYSYTSKEMRDMNLAPIQVPPKPFMRPAFDSKKAESESIIAKVIKQEVESQRSR